MNTTELNTAALNIVTGGGLNWLNSCKDMEDSPIFEGLKNIIAENKGHLDPNKNNDMNELELRLLFYARPRENGEFCFTRQTCRDFINKYFPLV